MPNIQHPNNRLAIIRAPEAQKFIQNFNKHKVTPEFLSDCKKASELFTNSLNTKFLQNKK